jgi:hypothetical protein
VKVIEFLHFCFAPVLADARTLVRCRLFISRKKKMQAFYNSFGLETLVIIDGELIKLTYNLG